MRAGWAPESVVTFRTREESPASAEIRTPYRLAGSLVATLNKLISMIRLETSFLT
jgi:hypothetical protein